MKGLSCFSYIKYKAINKLSTKRVCFGDAQGRQEGRNIPEDMDGRADLTIVLATSSIGIARRLRVGGVGFEEEL